MSVQIHTGDCREILRTLPEKSVHCCVTSPPYFGLRDYGHDGQIGLEETPEKYVAEMVDVFREVRRVLRDDGTLWLNLGDSYSSNGGSGRQGDSGQRADRTFTLEREGGTSTPPGLKPKDLIGIPWRVAFALQADGWYLRSDIIWAKPNPMPESVTDRPTKAHEYLFLLSKGERYFYDGDAVAEPCGDTPSGNGFTGRQGGAEHHATTGGSGTSERWVPNGTRNRRTVWTVATRPYSGAHFAVFPPALIQPCVLAGTSEKGCCPECGAPWERVKEKTGRTIKQQNGGPGTIRAHIQAQGKHGATSSLETGVSPEYRTVGWAPTCDHDHPPTSCTVLDPFGGAGTTGLVADRIDRDAVLIELNPEYASMAEKRIYGDAPLFADTTITGANP